MEPSSALYEPGSIKRKRRTKAEVGQLEKQILDVLREDLPQSIRHVFYRMTNPRLPEPVAKTDQGYKHVQNRITLMRRASTLPYGWISDATRRGYHINTYTDGAEFIRRMSGSYRSILWQPTNYHCEVWVESRSLAGVLERDCEDLAVSLYPCGGFSSITLAYQAAEHINAIAKGRQVIIFYVGDYDPAGVLIDSSLQKELREHLHPDISMSFIRLGITKQQVEKYDLPTKPRKKTEKRARHITETVEAEAMPAHIMRELVRNNVESLLPPGALQAAKAAEESERNALKWLGYIAEDIKGPDKFALSRVSQIIDAAKEIDSEDALFWLEDIATAAKNGKINLKDVYMSYDDNGEEDE